MATLMMAEMLVSVRMSEKRGLPHRQCERNPVFFPNEGLSEKPEFLRRFFGKPEP